MAISTTERSHPVVRAVESAARELAQAAEVPLWTLSAAELRELVVSLSRLGAAVVAVEATVLDRPTAAMSPPPTGRPRPRRGWRKPPT